MTPAGAREAPAHCAACGFEAAPGFLFCPKCGRRLPASCPACGLACAPEFAFCPGCGAALAAAPAVAPRPAAAPPAPEADRRLVTVLFADVAGFTALGERLDPEDVRAFQSDLFRMLAGAVQEYGGFVEKFVGDAVMAVFGAPVAHEDDAERALRTALAMRERSVALSARWEARLGGPVALHLGVNTGPVVAGRLGAGEDAAYAVTGDTVNTAARLLAAAGTGEIVASGATRRLAAHAFAFEALPPIVAKGKTEPVEVWRVRGLREGGRRAEGGDGAGLTAALVGRREELEQMLLTFERAVRGRAQIVSLVGEAGAGKSRLTDEFFAALEGAGRLAGATVRRTACSSLGEHAYGVIRAFLREGFDLAPGDSLEAALMKLRAGLRALGSDALEAERVAPALAHMLGIESREALAHLEPEQLRRQIFLATRLVVERRLDHGPVVLVVENMHWADAASLELLRFLADRLAERPLLLLATYRPGFDARALLTARSTQTSVRLAPLGEAESRALLEGLLGPGGRGVPRALHATIVERAGGNPLYLVEIVRNLIAAGALARGPDGWVARGDVAALDVPPTVQGLLLSRVDRLPPEARRVLQDAAVLGQGFEREVLQAMTGAPASLGDTLELLQDTGLIAEAPRPAGLAAGRRLRFTQALVQEVVYQNLLVARRTEAHDRAGTAYETLRGREPQALEDVEALGHHFSLGADRRRGAAHLVAAGDRARAVYANEDAVRNYARALRTLQAVGAVDEQCAVRERLGDVVAPLGRRAEAIAHYEAVRTRCAEARQAAAQARLERKLGGLYWEAGERERALERFRAGLALLTEGDADVEAAHLYREMGRLAFRSGDNARAVEWAERALRLAEPHLLGAGDAPLRREAAAVIAHAHNTIGVALARADRREDAVAQVERSIDVALAHDLLQAACRGYTNLGILYSTLDPPRGIATCQRGLETAKRIGDLGVQARLYANLAVAYCALTDRCEAEGIEAAQASIELDRQLGQLDHLAVPLIVLGQIHQCRGDAARALQYYREALALAEDAGEPQLLFPCYDGLATLHLDLDAPAEAERYLALAQELCARAGLDPDALVLLPFLD